VSTLGCPRASRARCVRPTSALRNISNSSTLASPFPSAATVSRGSLAASSRADHTRTEPCGSCSFTRNVFLSRSPFARPKTREEGTVWLGAIRCERGRGVSRFTTRHPLRRPHERCAGGVFFPLGGAVMSVSDTPVASSWLVGVGTLDATLFSPWPRGRQDRFRGGLVKGVRFPDPRCLPSLSTTHNPPAPRCEQTCDALFVAAALT